MLHEASPLGGVIHCLPVDEDLLVNLRLVPQVNCIQQVIVRAILMLVIRGIDVSNVAPDP